MQALTIRFLKFAQRLNEVVICRAIPIKTAVVAAVIARALGLVLMPFFHQWNAADHGVLDMVCVHLFQQSIEGFGLLEKINDMQVTVAETVVSSQACCGADE